MANSTTELNFLREKFENFKAWSEARIPEFVKQKALKFKETTIEQFVIFFKSYCKPVIQQKSVIALVALLIDISGTKIEEYKQEDLKKLIEYVEMFNELIE